MRNLRLILLVVIAAAFTTVVGCSSTTNPPATPASTTTTGGVLSQITAPTGTVTGLVQDTNGNPIRGATAYLGSVTATTNSGGLYIFNDVAVTNTVNLTGGTTEQRLIITIAPPAGYLGGSVTVTPAAQIDGISATGSANTATTFISGYTAQAGTAVLPSLQSNVSGVLRDFNTGQVIANTGVTLDFVNVIAAGIQSSQNSIATSYATQSYSATSDAAGKFSISNVPSDSTLTIAASGYTINVVSNSAVGTNVVTSAELQTVVLGDVTMTPILSVDNVAPYVTSVSGLANTNMFDNVTTGVAGITISFSETMAANVDGIYIIDVVDVDNGVRVSATSTLAADAKSITFTTATSLALGINLDINLLAADFHDLAGNAIAVSGISAPSVTYDALAIAATGTQYLQLNMQTWRDAVVGAAAVTAPTQDTVDNLGTNDLPALQALNPAFNDVWDGDVLASDFQGMNSAADTDGNLLNDAEGRLSALATYIQGAPVSVVSNQAKISFLPSNATYYAVSVRSFSGVVASADALSANVVPFDPLNPTTVFLTVAAAGGSFKVTDANNASLIIGSVAPGDIVTIQPFDDLGYKGTSIDIVLNDNVEPTTVLQPSYGVVTALPATVLPFGNGGQLSSAVTSTLVGTPYLNLTAALLDNVNPAGNSIIEELLSLNEVDANGVAYLPTALNIYDAYAYSVMPKKRTIGIAMSENVSLVGTPTLAGGEILSNWTANNDVLRTDNGVATNNDLVDFDVADVFALANNDHGKLIDLSNAVQDAALVPNLGTVAKVVLQDVMPPMVVSAFYNGSNIAINFNEPVSPRVGDVITLSGVNITISQATVTQSVGAQVLIDPADWGANLSFATVFGLNVYAPLSANPIYHATLNSNTIQDIHGNSWATAPTGILAPSFALKLNVARATLVTSISPTFAAAPVTSVFSVTYTLNHPVDRVALGTALVAAVSPTGPVNLTGAQVAAMFAYSGGLIAPTSSGALSANGSVLTISFDITPAVVLTGDTMTINPGFLQSSYDNIQAFSSVITAP